MTIINGHYLYTFIDMSRNSEKISTLGVSKHGKNFFKGTPSEYFFSTFLCHKVYGENRVQLKTSLSHMILKVEFLKKIAKKPFSFKKC